MSLSITQTIRFPRPLSPRFSPIRSPLETSQKIAVCGQNEDYTTSVMSMLKKIKSRQSISITLMKTITTVLDIDDVDTVLCVLDPKLKTCNRYLYQFLKQCQKCDYDGSIILLVTDEIPPKLYSTLQKTHMMEFDSIQVYKINLENKKETATLLRKVLKNPVSTPTTVEFNLLSVKVFSM